jgi:hypothetical protein
VMNAPCVEKCWSRCNFYISCPAQVAFPLPPDIAPRGGCKSIEHGARPTPPKFCAFGLHLDKDDAATLTPNYTTGSKQRAHTLAGAYVDHVLKLSFLFCRERKSNMSRLIGHDADSTQSDISLPCATLTITCFN